MKVLFLSNSDGKGGGYAAAFRLLQGLTPLDVHALMLVAEKTRGCHSVIGPATKIQKLFSLLRPPLDNLPLRLYKNRDNAIFSVSYLPDRVAGKSRTINPDLIHAHWVCRGFLQIETMQKFKKPIIWTLHDMWAFTGGCHYNHGCEKYINSCGQCPQLGSNRHHDLSYCIWRRKEKTWHSLDLTLVSPSKWLSKCAKESALFKNIRVEVIPNGIDTTVYKPIDKLIAREILGLKKNIKLILFGAMSFTSDKRKGFQYMAGALKKIGEGFNDDIEAVIFGASEPPSQPDFGLKVHYVGQFYDDASLSLLYSAADVFIAPSVQDNLPNTVMEALSCGTPCVAFNIGGMPDMIEHEHNGYLAQPFDVEDLTKGIAWVLSDDKRWQILSKNARRKVEQEFDLQLISQKYVNLYQEILSK